MTTTPNDILRDCLREAGADTEAGLLAAEYILSHGLDVAYVPVALSNFDPNQPRKPKGGPEGGEWVRDITSPTGYSHHKTGKPMPAGLKVSSTPTTHTHPQVPTGPITDEARPQLTDEEESALEHYTASAWINDEMRGLPLRPEATQYFTKERRDEVRQYLASAFAKAKPMPHPVMVYRGAGFDSAAERDEFLSNMQKAASSGEEIVEKGYMSTSTDKGSTEGYKGEHGVSVELEARRGIDLKRYGAGGVGEFLLDHHSRFKVKSIKTGEDGKPVVVLTQVLGDKTTFSTDVEGHQHRGRGTGGGQFTGTGGGGGNSGGSRTGDVKSLHKQLSSAMPDLTEDQSDGLDEYLSGAYVGINKSLRSGVALNPGERGHRQLKHIEQAIAAAPALDKPVTVHRGLRLSAEQGKAFLEKAQELMGSGQEMTDPAFVSTTIDRDIAHKWATGGEGADVPVVMNIAVTKGLYIGGSVGGTKEKEMILQRDSKFKINKINKEGDHYVVDAEQVLDVATLSISAFSTDATGHQHKGKGEGGGQFTGTGGDGGKSVKHHLGDKVKDNNGMIYEVVGHGKTDNKGRTLIFLNHPNFGNVKEYDTNLTSVEEHNPIAPPIAPPIVFGRVSNKKRIDATSDKELKILEARTNKGLSEELKKALQQYSESSYIPLNKALRSGDELPDDLEELASKLDAAFEAEVTVRGPGLKPTKSKVSDLPGVITVHRGINFGSKSDRDTFLKKLSSSTTVSFKGYMSTTVHKGIADRFSDDNPVRFVVNTARGIVMGDSANMQGEGEVLLSRNSKFAITAIKGNIVYMDHLE